MTGQGPGQLQATEAEVLAGDVARQILAVAPPWARAMTPRREADGRLMLVGESDGCYVWVQPKAWSKMTLRDDAAGATNGALNYGINMQGLASHAGQLETNDPRFGRELLAGQSTGTEVPLPDASPRSAPNGPGLVLPAAILALGLIVAALVARFLRRVN